MSNRTGLRGAACLGQALLVETRIKSPGGVNFSENPGELT
jgi:hypothetical protein